LKVAVGGWVIRLACALRPRWLRVGTRAFEEGRSFVAQLKCRGVGVEALYFIHVVRHPLELFLLVSTPVVFDRQI